MASLLKPLKKTVHFFLLLLAAAPGLSLAVAAKPFLLGELALWLGIALAFALPVVITLSVRHVTPSQKERRGKHMTESEWAACREPQELLEFLRDSGKASERKLRLFACACCRRVWHWLTDNRSRQAVEVAERYAEVDCLHPDPVRRLRLEQEVRKVWEAAGANWLLVVADPLRWATDYSAWAATKATRYGQRAGERRAQAALLRDVFGPLPFREAVPDPAWLTGTVRGLAEAAYDDRVMPAGTLDPGRLAELADALEEAGCTDSLLLGHLRGAGPHVRGCWAVDAVLGRA